MTKTPQKDNKTILNPQVIETKEIKREINPHTILNNNLQGKDLAFNRKKNEYKHFLKLIKQGKTITAGILAQTLGVSRQTIIEWYKTPKAIQSLAQDIDNNIEVIKESKDWRARAYLIDKVSVPLDNNETKSDLKQLIVINT